MTADENDIYAKPVQDSTMVSPTILLFYIFLDFLDAYDTILHVFIHLLALPSAGLPTLKGVVLSLYLVYII